MGKYLKERGVIDIIIFGSSVKGKAKPGDIDVAVITLGAFQKDIPGFHISVLKPEEFFRPISLNRTLLREGYSMKNKMSFSEIYGFSSRVLFRYELSGKSPSEKVLIVNALHGRQGSKGMVEQSDGEWIANQVFYVPTNSEHVFQKLFANFGIKYKKFYLLMH